MKKKLIIKKVKPIIIGILIGIIVLPTIVFGGSFVSSLIQGKAVDEAVQILAEQVDVLFGRVEVVETNQIEQEQTISELQGIIDQQKELIDQLKLQQQTTQTQIEKNKWCNEMEVLSKRIVAGKEMPVGEAVDYYNLYPPTAEGVLEQTLTQYQLYLQAKEKCGDRNDE